MELNIVEVMMKCELFHTNTTKIHFKIPVCETNGIMSGKERWNLLSMGVCLLCLKVKHLGLMEVGCMGSGLCPLFEAKCIFVISLHHKMWQLEFRKYYTDVFMCLKLINKTTWDGFL